jgi:hypothetical protein
LVDAKGGHCYNEWRYVGMVVYNITWKRAWYLHFLSSHQKHSGRVKISYMAGFILDRFIVALVDAVC